MTTGRNFDEVLRVIDSLQLTAKHKVATPVNWKQGENVIIAGSVSNDEAKETYPDGWEEPRPYIRIVPQPQLGQQQLRPPAPAGLEDPRRGAPDEVIVDDEGVGLEGDTAALNLRRGVLPARARSKRELEHGVDLALRTAATRGRRGSGRRTDG